MDKSDFKMTQTEMHAFEIHDKPSGDLLATITRDEGGAWSTHPHSPAAGDEPFDDQSKPQAAFDAFIARVRD